MKKLYTKQGFSVLELIMAVLVFGIISALAVTKYGDIKEKAYIDAMMNDLRNFALLEEQVHEGGSGFVSVDSLQARGFAFTRDVSADSSNIEKSRFYLRVIHDKTDRYCEIDYGKSLTGSAKNKIECPGGSVLPTPGENQEPVALFTVTSAETNPSVESGEEDLSASIESGWAVETGVSAGKFKKGELLKFDGSLSYDPDGDPLKFTWEFPDGTSAEGEEVFKALNETGVKDVRLVLSDGKVESMLLREVEIVAEIVTEGLVAVWDPCEGFKTQSFPDVWSKAGDVKYDGTLGASTAVESSDPAWSASPVGLTVTSLGQYVNIPALAGPQTSHTFVFTLWGPFVGGNPQVFGATGLNFYVGAYGAREFLFNDGGTMRQGGTDNSVLFDGIPHQVTLILDAAAGQARVYIDGVLHSTMTHTNPRAISSALFLRNNETVASNWIGGGIGATLYYNRVLTDAEVAKNYNNLEAQKCETPSSLEISPDPLEIVTGTSKKMDAEFLDDDGSPLPVSTETLTWNILNPGIATVDGEGNVSGVSLGSTQVIATADAANGGIADTATVEVVDLLAPEGVKYQWDVCASYGTNTLVDIVGGANGTLVGPEGVGGPTWDPYEPLLNSDRGVEQYVDVPGAASSSAHHTWVFRARLPTRSIWADSSSIWSAGTQRGIHLTSTFNGGSNSYMLPLFNTSYSTSNAISHSGSIVDGKIHTIAVSSKNNVGSNYISAYIDGAYLGSGRSYSSMTFTGSAFLKKMWGSVGDILYYDRALTAAEVEQAHQYLEGRRCKDAGVAEVILEPNPLEIVVSFSEKLTPITLDSEGNKMVRVKLLWESEDATIAVVDSSGTVTGVSEGQTTIFARTKSGVEGSAIVQVSDGAIIRDGLVAHWDPCVSWRTEEFVDVIGGKNGTLVGGLSWDAYEPLLNSERGVEQYVDVPTFSSYSQHHTWVFRARLPTRSIWADSSSIWSAGTQRGIHLTSTFNGGSNSYMLPLFNTSYSTSNAISHGGSILDGKMHTIAVSSQNRTGANYITAYIDGVYLGEGKSYSGMTFGGSSFLKKMWGSVGDVLYYNKALSEDEIKVIHTELSVPRCNDAGVAEIILEPDPLEIAVAFSEMLTPTILDSQGNRMVGVELLWESEDATIAVVDSSGTVTGVSEGQTTIFARTKSGVEGSAIVQVSNGAIIRDGLVAHWDPCVSWGTEEFVDVIGGQNGTLVGGLSWDEYEPLLNSERGVEQYVDVPTLSSSSSHHTWVFRTRLPTRSIWADSSSIWSAGTQRGIHLTVRTNGAQSNSHMLPLFNTDYSSSNEIFHGGAIVDGKMHTIAVSSKNNVGSNSISAYIDGAYVGSGRTYYGMTFTGSAFLRKMWGSVGDVLYYNRALSEDEIKAIHTELSVPRCNDKVVASVTLVPDTLEIAVGVQDSLHAIATDSSGQILPGINFDWTSSDTAVAVVDSTGLVTGKSPGTSMVIVTAPFGAADSSVVKVESGAVVSKGLVARWDPCLSHGTDELIEVVGGKNGTLVNNPAWGEKEAVLYSERGVEQYVDIPTFSSYSSHHTWVFRTRLPARSTWADSSSIWSAGTQRGIHLTVRTNGAQSNSHMLPLFNTDYSSSNEIFHGGAIVDGKMHTIAVSSKNNVGSNSISAYIDGAYVGSGRTYYGMTFEGSAFLRKMWGGLSSALYYDRALSETEIEALHEELAVHPCVDKYAPHALFDAAPNPAEASTTVVEFDASESWDLDNWIVSWDWDFGEWDTGTGETISRVFPSAGEYNVLLTVTDASGLTDTMTQTIVVKNAPPRAAFTFSPDKELTGTNITFDASASYDPDGTIKSYVWDFGDGTTRSTGSPTITHSYSSPGYKTVTLYVIDNHGLSSKDTQATLRRTTVGADSSAVSVTGLDAGDRVIVRSATDRIAMVYESSGSATINLPAAEIPAHTILVQNSLGVERATLSPASGIWGGDAYNIAVQPLQQQVTVNSAPVANPSATPNPQDEDSPVTFSGSSSFDAFGSIASYQWDFGDGNSGSGANTSHTYAEPGSYTATLTVTDDMGVERSADVVVTIDPVPPVARWSFTPDNEPSGTTVSFDGRNSYDPNGISVSYAWDFNGDGTTDATTAQATYVYGSAGSYQAKLTVTDVDGLTGEEVKTVTVILGPPPTANFTYTCTGTTCTFDDLSWDASPGSIVSWSWDFAGDGSSVLQNPSYDFGADGTYSVTLTVTDNDGRTDAVTLPVTTTGTGGPPIADFDFECGALTCDFFDQSKDANPGYITSWSWDFGGEGTSSAQNPAHTFSAAGTYTVTLTVTDNDGLVDTVSKPVDVADENQETPIADFLWNPASPTEGESITLSAVASYDPDGVIVSYEWDLDNDGVFETLGEVITHTYEVAGVKPVALRVTDDDGLTAVVTKNITVYSVATCSVSFDNPYDNGDGSWDYTDSQGYVYSGYMSDNRANSLKLRWGLQGPGKTSFDVTGGFLYGTENYTTSWALLRFGTDTLKTGTGNPSYEVGQVPQEFEVLLPQGAANYRMYVKPTVHTNYAVAVTAYINCGGTPGNTSPAASFTVDVTGETNTSGGTELTRVVFNASASSDPEGDALTYSWDDYNDGSIDAQSSSAIREVWAAPGSYSTKLYVSDGKGGTANTTRTWDVTVSSANYSCTVSTQSLAGSTGFDGFSYTASGVASDPANLRINVQGQYVCPLNSGCGASKNMWIYGNSGAASWSTSKGQSGSGDPQAKLVDVAYTAPDYLTPPEPYSEDQSAEVMTIAVPGPIGSGQAIWSKTYRTTVAYQTAHLGNDMKDITFTCTAQ